MQYKTHPFPHQEKALERFKDSQFFGLFWEMGTGKSKTAIDIASYKYETGQIDRVIVVAPNSVHQQWIDEQFPAHCNVNYKGFTYHTDHSKRFEDALKAFFTSLDEGVFLPVLALHIEAFQYKTIEPLILRYCKGKRVFWVIDEATRIKNPKANCTQRITALRHVTNSSACVLTGTSLAKGPLGVWSIMEFLKKGLMGCSYTAFEKRHAVMKKMNLEFVKQGRTISYQKDVLINEDFFKRMKAVFEREKRNKGELRGADFQRIAFANNITMEDAIFIEKSSAFSRYKGIDKLKTMLSPVVSFLKKEECIELPEKVYKEVVLPLGKEQRRILKELQKYSVATYGNETLTIQHKVNLQIRGLQVCGGFFPKEVEGEERFICEPINEKNNKLEYIKDLIDELGDQSFIVWAVFVPELEMLCKELQPLVSTGLLYGGTDKGEREKVIEDFKAGKIQCLVANPQVGGYGLNFQNAGTQIWYSRNYSTEARLQAEDRSHRINVKNSPVYIDLVYDVAFEQDVLRVTKEGRDMNSYFNSKSVHDLLEV